MKSRIAKYQPGFTLVELLIFLAIIGLLASFVLSAVSTARVKAADGSIEANLTQVRQVAAEIRTESDSYISAGNALCDVSNTLNDGNVDHISLATIENDIKKRNGGQDIQCSATVTRYCLQAKLLSGGDVCVDADGKVARSACDLAALQCQ